MGKRADEKSTEVAEKLSALNRQMDEIAAKIRSFQPPARGINAREVEIVAEVARKFKELRRIHRVLGQKVAGMTEGSEPERFQRYKRMLEAEDRCRVALQELDKLLDEQIALSRK